MKSNIYISPEIEVLELDVIDVLTASDDFVFLPPDEFREI